MPSLVMLVLSRRWPPESPFSDWIATFQSRTWEGSAWVLTTYASSSPLLAGM